MMSAKPRYLKAQGMSYAQAIEKGYLREGLITPEDAAQIEKTLIEP
jgi:hypothetical protein